MDCEIHDSVAGAKDAPDDKVGVQCCVTRLTVQHIYCWQVKCGKGGATHIFAAKSQAAKKKWMSEMQLQLQALHDRKSGPPATLPRVLSQPTLKSLPVARSLPAPPPAAGGSPAPKAKQGYEEWVLSPGAAPAPAPNSDAVAPAVATTDERWFAGRMPRSKADRLLETAANGAYMIRESDSRPVRRVSAPLTRRVTTR